VLTQKERIATFVNKGWIMSVADTYVVWTNPINPFVFIKVPINEVPLSLILN
jgi:hypothetical protein